MSNAHPIYLEYRTYDGRYQCHHAHLISTEWFNTCRTLDRQHITSFGLPKDMSDHVYRKAYTNQCAEGSWNWCTLKALQDLITNIPAKKIECLLLQQPCWQAQHQLILQELIGFIEYHTPETNPNHIRLIYWY